MGGNQLGGTSLESVTRVLGALDLQQFWPKSDLFLEYLGGGAFYANPYEVKQLQAAGLEAVTRWRTGQVTLRDAFSYLPDGSFPDRHLWRRPRIRSCHRWLGTERRAVVCRAHTCSAAVSSVRSETFRGLRTRRFSMRFKPSIRSPRSRWRADSATLISTTPPHTLLINSDQVTVEAGYSHLLSRHDQIGVIYAFQLFQFPQDTGGQIYNHIVNLRWSHHITGRLSLIAGAGPQYTELEQGGYDNRWSLSARVQLHYKFAHSSMAATYEKFTSTGSGFFAGANTQAARLGYTRPLGRTWDFYGDLGYSHNKKLQNVAEFGRECRRQLQRRLCRAVFRKHLGRTYDFFAAYRFSEVAFNVPVTFGGSTGRISHRNVGTHWGGMASQADSYRIIFWPPERPDW